MAWPLRKTPYPATPTLSRDGVHWTRTEFAFALSTPILDTLLGADASLRGDDGEFVGEVPEVPERDVDDPELEGPFVDGLVAGGDAEFSTIVTRATIPVPGSVVSHCCWSPVRWQKPSL